MYSLPLVIDSFSGQKRYLEAVELFLVHGLLQPFSRCLAQQLLELTKDDRFEALLENEERFVEELVDMHENDHRIVSDKDSLRTLTFGQAVCLYLSHNIPNFPIQPVQELLVGSQVKLVKTYLILDESVENLSEAERDLLYGSWLEKAQVKILDRLRYNVNYDDIFYYCVVSEKGEEESEEGSKDEYEKKKSKDQYWLSTSAKVMNLLWFDDDLPRNAKVFVQGPIQPEMSLRARELFTISSPQDLIEIISSRKRENSHGIVSAHFSQGDHPYSLVSKLVKYLRGWTFMGSYPASYCDYRQLQSLTTAEYPDRGRSYFPATLRNTVSVKSLTQTNLPAVAKYLSKMNLEKNCLSTFSTSDRPKGLSDYTLRETGYKYNQTLIDRMPLQEMINSLTPKESNDQNLVMQEYFNQEKASMLRLVLVAATWDVFIYDQALLFKLEDGLLIEEGVTSIPKDLSKVAAGLVSFFRGIPTANIVTRYGYLVYSCDFILSRNAWKLFEISAENSAFIFHDRKTQDKSSEWLIQKCILPTVAPVDSRLVAMEFIKEPKTIAQFEELVANQEKMQYIGTGEAWTKEDIALRFQEYYADAFRRDSDRDYFDWVLIDKEDNVLAYVSIRKYKYLGKESKQIRVVSRVDGQGHGRRAVFLAHNSYFLRNGARDDAREMYAVVGEKNKASLHMFDSFFPTWRRIANKHGNAIYLCEATPSLQL